MNVGENTNKIEYPSVVNLLTTKPTLSTNMTIAITDITDDEKAGSNQELDNDISCSACRACCCRLEVMLLTDTGVPAEYISTDEHGSETMARLDDGFCVALNRDTNMCSIYENRPWVCRIFETGSFECIDERAAGLNE